MGLVEPQDTGYRLVAAAVRSFGETLEWFVARLLEDEFHGEVLWGIRAKGCAPGGDYDVVAQIEHELLYVEAKSSQPKHINQQIEDTILTSPSARVKNSPMVSILWGPVVEIARRSGNSSAVEHRLAKARVAGSNPVSRSLLRPLHGMTDFVSAPVGCGAGSAAKWATKPVSRRRCAKNKVASAPVMEKHRREVPG